VNKGGLGAASAWLLMASAVSAGSMVLFHSFLSRRLGSDYAQVVALNGVLNVLGSVTLGLNTYLVKAFSADAELKGPGAVKGRLLLLLKPGLLTLGAMTLLLLLASPLVAAYLKLPSVNLVLIVDVLFVSGVVMLVYRAAQQGLHHFGWYGGSLAGEGLARLGLVASPWTSTVAGGLLSLLAGQVVGIGCAILGLLGLGQARRPMQRPNGEDGLRHGLVEGGGDTVALVLLALISYMDVLVLKHHYSDDRAGLYSRAALLAKSFLYLPAALNTILLAAAARELAGGRDPRRLLERFLLGALVLDLAGLAVVWAATPFCLYVLAGPDPRFQTPEMLSLTRWFSVAVLPLGLLQMVVVYLLAIRRRGVALGMGVLSGVYLVALQAVWNSETAVVAALGACSAAGLAWALWSALAHPPRPDAWAHT
jgi:O-antigen/teichoic acid export membrane protein